MTIPQVSVLRLGHRKGRDPRITTHLGLVARAFGADAFHLSGDEDEEMFEALASVGDRFGAPLKLEHEASPIGLLRRFTEEDAGDGSPGVAIHLTMYGEGFRAAIPRIRRDRPIMIVVGGVKVPGEIYKMCQYNVAVGNQPHSEVAALGLFLDAWSGAGSNRQRYLDGRLEVRPNRSGKTVIDREDE